MVLCIYRLADTGVFRRGEWAGGDMGLFPQVFLGGLVRAYHAHIVF